jgi:uncharacterized membrane protein
MNESKTNGERSASAAAAPQRSRRIAAIDWMRGFVMILMVIDHASMAFDGHHIAKDSALYPDAATMALPTAAFLTRWITHICAPTFVFLAGTALALSVERRVAKGVNAWEIDKGILIRGAIIALLDPTIISLGSGRMTLQVLLAIGVAMMCMAPLRRLPSAVLLSFGLGWFAFGELLTGLAWAPGDSAPVWAALTMATYGSDAMIIKYPVLPWLAMMVLGWVFGRHMNNFSGGKSRVSPATVMLIAGVTALAVFAVARGLNGYGNMFLPRADNSWQQWLHVSKYPPSLTYAGLELGLMSLFLWGMMKLEAVIGVRENSPLLVFGQTAMFFYLIHRLVFEVPATYFGERGAGSILTTYVVSAILLVAIYPACRWYRSFKAAHPQSFLKYF